MGADEDDNHTRETDMKINALDIVRGNAEATMRAIWSSLQVDLEADAAVTLNAVGMRMNDGRWMWSQIELDEDDVLTIVEDTFAHFDDDTFESGAVAAHLTQAFEDWVASDFRPHWLAYAIDYVRSAAEGYAA